MPAKPAYSHRLAEAADTLEAIATSWVDRRQLEEALGISKTVAWRIMRQCGATRGPGGTLVCDRAELVRKLRAFRLNETVHQREIQRRDRLEQFLSNVRPSVVANLTQIATDKRALTLLSSTFRKLPPNVELTPHTLQIRFSGMEDFLSSVGAVVYALHNDLEEIQNWIEGSR